MIGSLTGSVARQRRIGVNVASLLLGTLTAQELAEVLLLGADSIRCVNALLAESGFQGIQALPIRKWRPPIAFPREKIISFEDAWNSGALFWAIMRKLRFVDHPYPTLADWALFGTKRMARRQFDALLNHSNNGPAERPIFVRHHLSDRGPAGPIEIHPEAEMGCSLQEALASPDGIVWDTRHTRRDGHNGLAPPLVRDWRELAKLVQPRQIKLIHFQPLSADERDRTLNGQETELRSMLDWLAVATADHPCPIIVENKGGMDDLIEDRLFISELFR